MKKEIQDLLQDPRFFSSQDQDRDSRPRPKFLSSSILKAKDILQGLIPLAILPTDIYDAVELLQKWNFSKVNLKMIKNIEYLVNKSNSTASSVQVEANLQEQLNDHLHFIKQMLLKC